MTEALRDDVAELVALGPMPTTDEADVDPARADRWEALIGKVFSEGKVTVTEAAALVWLFPEDESDCYGVAWTLVHVIESAPGWPVGRAVDQLDGPWAVVLRQRAHPEPDA